MALYTLYANVPGSYDGNSTHIPAESLHMLYARLRLLLGSAFDLNNASVSERCEVWSADSDRIDALAITYAAIYGFECYDEDGRTVARGIGIPFPKLYSDCRDSYTTLPIARDCYKLHLYDGLTTEEPSASGRTYVIVNGAWHPVCGTVSATATARPIGTAEYAARPFSCDGIEAYTGRDYSRRALNTDTVSSVRYYLTVSDVRTGYIARGVVHETLRGTFAWQEKSLRDSVVAYYTASVRRASFRLDVWEMVKSIAE